MDHCQGENILFLRIPPIQDHFRAHRDKPENDVVSPRITLHTLGTLENFETTVLNVILGRAVAGKLGRFNEKYFQEFVPESFRWTDCMSRPGTKFLISENVSR